MVIKEIAANTKKGPADGSAEPSVSGTGQVLRTVYRLAPGPESAPAA
jgi:hypothetical protein